MTPYFDEGGVRIYLGESLEVLPALQAEGFDALVTDPPYSSGGAFRGDRTMSTVTKYVQTETQAVRHDFSGDTRDQRSFLAWCALWMTAARAACRSGAHALVFTDWRQLPVTTDAVQAAGWVWRGIAPWDKTQAVRPRENGLRAQAEYVVWGTNGPHDPKLNPGVYLPGVFQCPVVRDREHIAQKPTRVMEWLVRLAPPGGLVLDPFMGSGSTLVAARALGRRGVGVEIDERSCEVAARRVRDAAALEDVL